MQFKIIPPAALPSIDLESIVISGIEVPVEAKVDVLGTIFSTAKDVVEEFYDCYYTIYPIGERRKTASDPFHLQLITNFAVHSDKVEPIEAHGQRHKDNSRNMIQMFESMLQVFVDDPAGLATFNKYLEENPESTVAEQSKYLKQLRDDLMIKYGYRTKKQVATKRRVREAEEARKAAGHYHTKKLREVWLKGDSALVQRRNQAAKDGGNKQG